MSHWLIRWQAQYAACYYFLTDRYPQTFSPAATPHPVEFKIDYPERSSRMLALFRWLIALPAAAVFGLFSILVLLLLPVSWAVVIIMGRLPRGLFEFQEGALRWNFRLTSYLLLMRDEHPPYSTRADAKPISTFEGFVVGALIIGVVFLVVSAIFASFQGGSTSHHRKRQEEDDYWEEREAEEKAREEEERRRMEEEEGWHTRSPG
jgi:hypothetical protein